MKYKTVLRKWIDEVCISENQKLNEMLNLPHVLDIMMNHIFADEYIALLDLSNWKQYRMHLTGVGVDKKTLYILDRLLYQFYLWASNNDYFTFELINLEQEVIE